MFLMYRRMNGTCPLFIPCSLKLSMAFYNTIVFGKDYVEEGNKRYKERLKEKERALLEKLARKHNVTLLPTSA